MGPYRFDRPTRHLARRSTRRTGLRTFFAGLASAAMGGGATRGSVGVLAVVDDPAFLFVQTFAAGRGELNPAAATPVIDGTPSPGGGARFLLTLEGHAGQTIYFSDRPAREVGAVPTQAFLEGLGFGVGNPPNAALVAEFESGQGVVVLQLIEPDYDAGAGTLRYGAEVLQGYGGENLQPVIADQVAARLPAEFGPAALFIDDCPDVTRCKRNDPVDSFFIEYEVHDVGPIPGGPYGRCWSWKTLNCDPCSYSWEEFNAFCNEGYPDQCPEWNCYAK